MSFSIGGRAIGPDHTPYVIAELSGNHNGDPARALALLRAAHGAGADAVKLQTYTADTLTIDHEGPGFVIEGGLWAGRRLYDLYREAHTPWDWHPALIEEGRRLGIPVFSTPFDDSAVAFLDGLGVPAFKIASFELVDLPLIEAVARTGKPTILSTGMASDEEIAEALACFRAAGGRDAALLHCVSGYPTPAAESHLRRIPYLRERFGTVTGLSDHTLGTDVAIAAAALGAAILEKHVTLARADGGPDAAFSLEPAELAELVTGARTAWAALGDPRPRLKPCEQGNHQLRRSIYVVADLRAGEPFTEANIRIIRPGFGLPPREWRRVLGRRAACDLVRGTPLGLTMIREDT